MTLLGILDKGTVAMITPITRGLGRDNTDKLNQVIEAINQLTKLTGGPGINVNKSMAGYSLYLDFPTLIRRIRFNRPATGTALKIFEVQSDRTDLGDGIYNCYKQKLDTTEWTGTGGGDKFVNAEETPEEVEVFNFEESDVVTADPDYTPALALYDLVEAYQITDEEGTERLVGKPMVTMPRLARATEDAPEDTKIICNLILRNGAEAAVGELGYNIEVYANISGGGDLNAALPRLACMDYLAVENNRGKWHISQVIQGSEECVCTPPE